MKTQAISCALFALAVLVCQAAGQNAPNLLPTVVSPVGGAKEQPKDKDKDKKAPEKKLTDPPATDIFAEAPMGPQFPTGFNPQMLGDKQVYFARRFLAVTGTTTTTVTPLIPSGPTTTTAPAATTQNRTALVPVPNHGAFNVAENSSPMPQDRVFAFWNHYSRSGYGDGGQNAPISTSTTTQQTLRNNFGGVISTTVTTTLPGAPRVDADREVFGFEKTFLNGYASFELRAPVLQQGGGGANFGVSAFGDITVIGKYAIYLDRNTGNVISTGLGVTVPTGRSINTTDGNFHDTLFQPYVGFIWNFDRFYVQGFSSVAIPTDIRDVTQAFNSVGVNYWLYRGNPGRLITFVVPTIEGHVTTPLNHRDLNGPLVVPDTIVMTSGVHLGIGRNATLSFGAAAPVTGPRPFRVEGTMQLNLRY